MTLSTVSFSLLGLSARSLCYVTLLCLLALSLAVVCLSLLTFPVDFLCCVEIFLFLSVCLPVSLLTLSTVLCLSLLGLSLLCLSLLCVSVCSDFLLTFSANFLYNNFCNNKKTSKKQTLLKYQQLLRTNGGVHRRNDEQFSKSKKVKMSTAHNPPKEERANGRERDSAFCTTKFWSRT